MGLPTDEVYPYAPVLFIHHQLQQFTSTKCNNINYTNIILTDHLKMDYYVAEVQADQAGNNGHHRTGIYIYTVKRINNIMYLYVYEIQMQCGSYLP